MPKAKPKSAPQSASVEGNLLIAIGVTSIVSILCAAATAYLIQATLDAFSSSTAMVGLITDSGLVFDDKNTERQLSNATLALKTTRDIALAMAVGSSFVAIGLLIRAVKAGSKV